MSAYQLKKRNIKNGQERTTAKKRTEANKLAAIISLFLTIFIAGQTISLFWYSDLLLYSIFI